MRLKPSESFAELLTTVCTLQCHKPFYHYLWVKWEIFFKDCLVANSGFVLCFQIQ